MKKNDNIIQKIDDINKLMKLKNNILSKKIDDISNNYLHLINSGTYVYFSRKIL